MRTIAALATPKGYGGIGVVRISGPNAYAVAKEIVKRELKPRFAHFCAFTFNEAIIDEGLAIYFPGPRSYTGEDVVELQGHGGPVVMDMLLSACYQFGATPAQPGEFTQQAFLNGRLDLAQVEAVADLIHAGSAAAANSAVRSLKGEFSRRVHTLMDAVIDIRKFVEAAIDFSDEDIEFLEQGKIAQKIENAKALTETLLRLASCGEVLREGLSVCLLGRPNAGKSSILNILAQSEVAIVTDIPGTTRDLIKTTVLLDGTPVHLTDTAGIRTTDCTIEKMGVARSLEFAREVDHILLVVDVSKDTVDAVYSECIPPSFPQEKVTIVANKCDLVDKFPTDFYGVKISAKTGQGIDLLLGILTKTLQTVSPEGVFSARRRHINALERAQEKLIQSQKFLEKGFGDLVAHTLREATDEYGSILGRFTNDDLLGEIFSNFCIGK